MLFDGAVQNTPALSGRNPLWRLRQDGGGGGNRNIGLRPTAYYRVPQSAFICRRSRSSTKPASLRPLLLNFGYSEHRFGHRLKRIGSAKQVVYPLDGSDRHGLKEMSVPVQREARGRMSRLGADPFGVLPRRDQ